MSTPQPPPKKLSLKQAASSRKINSPLAKYNQTGQLFCVLCNAQIKNEIYWTAHINGKSHKDNLQNLKKSSQTTSLKRPAPETTQAPAAPQQQPPQKLQKLEDEVKKAEEDLKLMIGAGSVQKKVDKVEVVDEEEVKKVVVQTPLPEGFFDDPKEDAKARGMKFRDKMDVEFDKFVKEIASEDIRSHEIVGADQEKSTVERELDHIEDQMAQWQRVIQLEKKAEEYAKQRKQEKPSEPPRTSSNMEVDSDNDEVDEDYDEELDWRNKKR